MGSNCSCLRGTKATSAELQTDLDLPIITPKQQAPPLEFEGCLTIEYIITLQCVLRGFLERRANLQRIKSVRPSLVRRQDTFGPRTEQREDSVKSPTVRLPGFVYDSSHDSASKKNPVVLQDKSVYIGEWNEKEQRHGRGRVQY